MERRFGNRDNRFDRQRPVQEGEELDVHIEAVGEKGDGVAKKDGFVLFVPNTQTGDNVRVKVTKVLNKVGFADVVGKAESKPESKPEPNERKVNLPEQESEEDLKDSEDFGEEDED